MANDKVRLAAAKLLLDRGVRFTISGAPVVLRLLRLNRIHIRPLRAGTIICMSRIMDENGIDELEMPKEYNQKLDVVALLIATAMLNGKYRIKFFARLLSRILLWKVPAKVLRELYLYVATVDKLADFMTITAYFGIQARMMMNPRMTGQMKKGS